MGRKERELQQRKKEILDVALRLFSQKGYRATSMQEIAKSSEFAVGTIYRFFPTKKRLYEEIVLDKAKEIYNKIVPVFNEDLDPFALLNRLIAVKIAVLKSYSSFIRLYYTVLWEARFGVKETLSEQVLALYEKYLCKLEAVFAKGIEEGIFRRRSSRFYAMAFEGMFNALIQESIHHDLEFSPNEVAEVFFGGILVQGMGR